MAYYDSFLKITRTPKEAYREQQQNVLDTLFDNSPTIATDVEEEDEFGSLLFHPIHVRITSLIDAKSGQRINDDFKKIIYDNINYEPRLGTRYRFHNNIWILFSTDNTKSITKSGYLRRCNNTINTQDEFGNIHHEPCIIDYSLTEAQIFKEYSIDIARGTILMTCQLNDWTKQININSRFVFGNDAYKVRIRKYTDRRETMNINSSYILFTQLEYNNIADDDNLELQIADYKTFDYDIDTMKQVYNQPNTENQIFAMVYLNNHVIHNVHVEWESSDTTIATIDKVTGKYRLLQDGQCEFIGHLAENTSVTFSVPVKVASTVIIGNKVNRIVPEQTYIQLNHQQEYQIYEYINGERQDTGFDIFFTNAPQKNYSTAVIDNAFIIKNLRTTDEPLKVICRNRKDGTEARISIELGGLF